MENSTSTTFRTKVTSQVAESRPPAPAQPLGRITTDVEAPFTGYHKQNGAPFTVEYFDLGDLWDDPKGGFSEEVSTLEQYFQHKIQQGDISDSVSSIKSVLKDMEKVNNLKNEDRKVIKLGVLSAYAKFLMETDGVRVKARKYGSY